MQAQRLLVKLESGWTTEYGKTRRFNLPNNKKFIYSAVENLPNQYFFDMGVSVLAINPGSSPSEQGLTYERAGTFITNPNHIKSYAQNELGGKYIENFSEQEAETSSDRYVDAREDGLSVIVSGLSEYNDSNIHWAPCYRSNGDPRRPACQMQYVAVDRKFGARLRVKGGIYFGDYDGHMGISILYSNDLNAMKQCFTDGNYALQQCKQYLASGAGNPFFVAELWKVRGGLINTYFGSSDVSPVHLASLLTNFHINRFVLQYVGAPDTPMCSFSFLSKREFPGVSFGYSEGYRNKVSDGFMETYSFSLHGAQWQMFLSYASLNYVSHLFTWEDNVRRGIDKNVVIPDENREGDNFPIYRYYGNQSPQRATTTNAYAANRTNGYVEMQYGPGHDAYMIGIENWCKMTEWASQNWKYTSHRPVGGNWCSNDATYIADRYEQNQQVVMLHYQGRRRAFCYYDVVHEPGTFHSMEIDLDGGTFAGEFEAGVPYFFLVDLDAGGVA